MTVKSTGGGFESAALSSATQHAMSPEFGGKWGTECLNTRFLQPTLVCAGYSVKLKKILRNMPDNTQSELLNEYICCLASLASTETEKKTQAYVF